MIASALGMDNRNLDFIDIGKRKLLFSRLANVLLRVHIHDNKLINNWLIRTSFKFLLQPIISAILHKNVGLLICHEHGYTSRLKTRKPNVLLIGYFQSHEYAATVREEVKMQLASIESAILPGKVHFNPKAPPKALIIHVRRGDYLTESTIGCLDDSYFLELVELTLNEEKFEEVWVIAENREMAKFLEKRLPRNTYFYTGEDLNTMETLALMTMGSGYIISNSTFSWWGAFLNRNQTSKAKVKVPSPWYREIREPNLLIPQYWEKSRSIWIN
jgi:hypothetical protein